MTACGSDSHQSSDTGSISFNIKLSHPTTMSRAAAATSADICADYGIIFINVNLSNSSGSAVDTGSWSCSAHEGTIYDVPAGSGYIIEITGTVSGGSIAWRGEMSGVVVTAGELTDTGVIALTYTGEDVEPPEIESSTPSSEVEATDVPVTSVVTVKFKEKMAPSTINDSTFTLNDNVTTVSGSVVYDAVTPKAIFLPSDNLSYSTTYTATLTTDIADMAGNKMLSVYSWSFRTEEQPPPDTVPAAPTGLIAASGNGQNTITWDAVQAATSYNIYWADTSGVTKTSGTKIPGISTNSYTHTGLTNRINYYYIVTSVNSNSNEESVESYEIASAPGSVDGAPPTGSISINNGAATTTSEEVTLSLLSSSTKGVSQMCISNTNPCSSWEPYTTSKSWILTTGDGFKFVYVWFEDSTGVKNDDPYSNTITLDTTTP